MLADQRERQDADDQRLAVAAVHQYLKDGRHRSRQHGGQRRVAEGEGDEQPGAEHGEAEQRVERQQDAGAGGDTLAALELEEDRKQVAEENGQRDEADHVVAEAHFLGDEDRDPALERVADQREQRSLLVTAAQDVGGARVARAIAARVGESEKFRGNHRKGNRAKQVSGEDGEKRGDGGFHKSLKALGYNRGEFYTAAAVDRPMDIIFIEELRAETWIGIYPREKAMPQTVEISLQIGVSTASAGASDDIRDTVDYAVVVERLRSDLAASHFNLLEKLAEHVATYLLENFAAQWVRVSVAKLGMLPGVKRVGVIIERSV